MPKSSQPAPGAGPGVTPYAARTRRRRARSAAASAAAAVLLLAGCGSGPSAAECLQRSRDLNDAYPGLDAEYRQLEQAWEGLQEERRAIDPAVAAMVPDWDALIGEWESSEHRLAVFIDLADGEPQEALYPIDPRRHHNGWSSLFVQRASLNDVWSYQSAHISEHADETPGGEQIAYLFDRYEVAASLWSEHWADVATWHQIAADLAWECY